MVAATPGTDYVATNPVFVASGASHAAGLVPDPGASAGTTRFLREDAAWFVPAAGSGGIPGGSSGQIQWNNSGAFGGYTMSGDATIVTSTGVITVSAIGGKAVTLGGALTTSGAFSTTLTVTANTNVTLPTSGTLVNTTVATLSSLAGVGTLTSGTTGPGFTIALATSTVTGTLPIANGGTGLNSGITGIVKGSGTAYAAATPGTDYQAPITGNANLPVAMNSGGTAPVASPTPIIPTSVLTFASTTNIDATLSNRLQVTLTGNVTFTISGMKVDQVITLNLIQDATGSRTVTWFGGITWAGGSPPTLQTAANAVDTLVFWCRSSGVYQGYLTTPTSGGGSGTVTSVATGTGLTGGPITGTGTIAVATSTANTLAGYNNSGASRTLRSGPI